MMEALHRFPERPLRDFAETILTKKGARPKDARTVADTLIEADRRGVHTHGLIRLPSYCAQIDAGEIDVSAEPHIEREYGATAWIDGGLALGAVTGTFAMDEAMARAEQYGIGLVAARRCTHFGTAAYYALRATERGFLGLAATNTPGVMAPWGGAEPRLGNNPFALAAPLPGRPPFVLDMAQSAVARGRIKLAELNGERIPTGWAIDPAGRPATDPTKALAGALLPFGGYKAYALALAVEILTGVLAGGGLSPELLNTSMTGAPSGRSSAKVGSVGNLYGAVDPSRFAGREAFLEQAARLAAAITSTPPAPGYEEVLLPGEPEARAAALALAEGVGLQESAVESLEALGQCYGLPFPTAASVS
jgi:LDH2 family malate/lactate/ureidoglycolate dehydrogenase